MTKNWILIKQEGAEPEIKCEYGKDSVTLLVKWAKITDRVIFRQNGETPDFQRVIPKDPVLTEDRAKSMSES